MRRSPRPRRGTSCPTLHTIDAQETINRIVTSSPHEQQIRTALAHRAGSSRSVVRRQDGSGRAVAVEVLVNTGRTQEAIPDPIDATPIIDLIAEGGFTRCRPSTSTCSS